MTVEVGNALLSERSIASTATAACRGVECQLISGTDIRVCGVRTVNARAAACRTLCRLPLTLLSSRICPMQFLQRYPSGWVRLAFWIVSVMVIRTWRPEDSAPPTCQLLALPSSAAAFQCIYSSITRACEVYYARWRRADERANEVARTSVQLCPCHFEHDVTVTRCHAPLGPRSATSSDSQITRRAPRPNRILVPDLFSLLQ